MTKETEILIPKEYEVKVGDRTYQMKRLGVSSTIKLVRFVQKSISENTEIIGKLKAAAGQNISDFEDIMNIVEVIGDEQAYKLFAMMLGEEDYKYFNDTNFGLPEMTS